MLQDWISLTFLHWPYSPAEIERFLPRGLTLDLFDGQAWVTLAPFLLRSLRPPWAPQLPWLSQFPETNLRTYVRGPDGEPGIWFFTLEAARLAAVAGARATFGLPYHWARMSVAVSGNRVDYSSTRHAGRRPARTRIRIETGDPLEPDDLAIFLTARFRLYSVLHGRLSFADVYHEPWPFYHARASVLEQTLTDASGLASPRGSPLAQFSPGVHVKVGRLHNVSSG
jgi:uncharacterized protein YqjF (DUF2071 family)